MKVSFDSKKKLKPKKFYVLVDEDDEIQKKNKVL